MAELYFSWHAHHIQKLRDAGRGDAAIVHAATMLRRGLSDRLFLNEVANLLDGEKGPIGRPKLSEPFQWHDMGRDFDEMVAEGIPKGVAQVTLANDYRTSVRTVQRTLKYYHEWREQADD